MFQKYADGRSSWSYSDNYCPERGRAEQSSTVDMKKQNCPESKLAEGQKMF